MVYQIIFSTKAEKQFMKLSKTVQRRIVSVLERIRIRPGNYLSRLAGLPYYKLRVGDYRLIIDLQKNLLIIYVIKVAHRKNIYRNLK